MRRYDKVPEALRNRILQLVVQVERQGYGLLGKPAKDWPAYAAEVVKSAELLITALRSLSEEDLLNG
jgi:hypothetical protein